MDKVKVSVRHLVEFILRAGDIDTSSSGIKDVQALWEGSAAHRRIQKQGGPGYQAEVPLKMDISVDEDLVISVEGRADGVIEEQRFRMEEDTVPSWVDSTQGNLQEPGIETFYTIDEIKGTYRSLRKFNQPEDLHLAQARCYAYLYAAKENLSHIGIQVTYVHLDSGKVKHFQEENTFADLEEWFLGVVGKYAVWVRWSLAWKKERNASISQQEFPFPYRPGQRRLVSGVYQTILQEKRLFIQAPTGTGKTIATVFPAVKVMGEGKSEKLFYLTAKTMTRTVAQDTFDLLEANGLKFKYIVLTAKEKCCVLEEPLCDPLDCPRAKGHFDRINDAVFALVTKESRITMETVAAYAQEYQVCPYELALDASEWVDGVICDYNYVFDPHVYLKRFFAESKKDYILLIDEAHNLVERAREMYSASISIQELKSVRLAVGKIYPQLSSKILKCENYLKEVAQEHPGCSLTENSGTLSVYLMRMMEEMEKILRRPEGAVQKEDSPLKNVTESEQEVDQTADPQTQGVDQRVDLQAKKARLRQEILKLYLQAKEFTDAYEAMDEKRYLEYGQTLNDADYRLKIYCVDPSKDLSQHLEQSKAAIFFSATLLPIKYYKELLSDTAKTDYDLYARSPFDPRHCLLIAASDVSSRYTRRNEQEYERISDYIRDIIRAKNGNYLIFFPSYAYMQSVFEVFAARELVKAGSAIEVRVQESNMTEQQREEFLQTFETKAKATRLGFCVLGGIFAEGIDLKGNSLIGVIIVGTGLPGMSEERELLRAFYNEKKDKGFEYAYLYPGMNKVLQAAGRVIRTETDRGVIALLDDRFQERQYRDLFPREWENCQKVTRQTVSGIVEEFWSEEF